MFEEAVIVALPPRLFKRTLMVPEPLLTMVNGLGSADIEHAPAGDGGVAVGLGDGVGLVPGVGVDAGVGHGLDVGAGVGDADGEPDGEGEGDDDGDGDADADGDGEKDGLGSGMTPNPGPIRVTPGMVAS